MSEANLDDRRVGRGGAHFFVEFGMAEAGAAQFQPQRSAWRSLRRVRQTSGARPGWREMKRCKRSSWPCGFNRVANLVVTTWPMRSLARAKRPRNGVTGALLCRVQCTESALQSFRPPFAGGLERQYLWVRHRSAPTSMRLPQRWYWRGSQAVRPRIYEVDANAPSMKAWNAIRPIVISP
jgi:hypothetical protein